MIVLHIVKQDNLIVCVDFSLIGWGTKVCLLLAGIDLDVVDDGPPGEWVEKFIARTYCSGAESQGGCYLASSHWKIWYSITINVPVVYMGGGHSDLDAGKSISRAV